MVSTAGGSPIDLPGHLGQPLAGRAGKKVRSRCRPTNVYAWLSDLLHFCKVRVSGPIQRHFFGRCSKSLQATQEKVGQRPLREIVLSLRRGTGSIMRDITGAGPRPMGKNWLGFGRVFI